MATLRCTVPRAYPHLLATRRRCSSSASSSPVDHSFTSTHAARDGRVFRFATVVVNRMGKGQSALPAWQHACSLVKANPPTLAIAFISRPTHSALAAVSELAHEFSVDLHDVGTALCYKHETRPDLSCKVGHPSQHGPHTVASCISGGQKDPFLSSHEVDASTSGRCTPVCENHETILHFANPSSNSSYMPSFTSPLTQMPTISYENTWTDAESQAASVPPLIGCVVADQGRVALTTPIIRASTQTSDDLLWLEAPDDIGDDTSGGSDAGDGVSVIDDNKSDYVGDNSDGRDRPSHCNMHSRNVPNIQRLSEQMLEDETWNPYKRRFSIEVTEPNTGGKFKNLLRQYEEQLVGISLRESRFSQITEGIQGNLGQHTDFSPSKRVAREAEFCGCCKPKSFSQFTDENRANKDQTHDNAGEEEETYMLSLCVANMPGVKATGFYSRTTKLPWLPDLRNAVTTNHPHMLLLGAPGFDLVEFNELLARMFPNGSRAGASLLTMEEGKIEVSKDKKDVKVFCGLKLASTGAVGLSLTPTGEAGVIPVDAFADLVCMSIGMPHGSCWNIHFDEAVCKSLFLPRRGKVEWLGTWQRAYKVNPDLVRKKIHTRLLSEYSNISSSHEHISDMNVDEMEKLSVISVDKVLFPGFFIPLLIESPCDRLMVKQCMDQCEPFGVMSLCTEISPDPINCKDLVGTTAT